jgi:hypothetical protein
MSMCQPQKKLLTWTFWIPLRWIHLYGHPSQFPFFHKLKTRADFTVRKYDIISQCFEFKSSFWHRKTEMKNWIILDVSSDAFNSFPLPRTGSKVRLALEFLVFIKGWCSYHRCRSKTVKCARFNASCLEKPQSVNNLRNDNKDAQKPWL